MTDIVFASGAGTRLYPSLKGRVKITPILDKPMGCYPISVLALATSGGFSHLPHTEFARTPASAWGL